MPVIGQTTVTGTAKVISNLQNAVKGIQSRAHTAATEIADLLETYAKQNHPWQNDTGETERTTRAGITEFSDRLITVTLTTGTDYSVFLELARSGKWAWLWPTLLACEPQIIAILKKHLGLQAANSFGFALRRTNV